MGNFSQLLSGGAWYEQTIERNIKYYSRFYEAIHGCYDIYIDKQITLEQNIPFY